ncbi:phosphatidylserine decarboxylase [Solemya velum gill symbiont]|uniref:Phosphatidylserine decarboxylase proenzyme n=1 Tax=Solemya velum gill symbiont TaxID=2340 RepID=A0A1T2CK16_SOVGS|nr:archaetidylserine decarboxylase [Solemya velum gill symbiont]OOY35196.1 phosphatidylserine decarboxylase [Solemya velum gill symbiont]OOY37889.1 phosphatidylserine decarboxylase [Solemya velum gill symbiont]OOY41150.1 phosphatidylserine decarboxylase [Solemya velum gill symbiont]OOY43906.1 phosphatidylserine decarboxylase [Solemya velum gill symbiont]OOY44707.1 phosphatidylserine decarboxylase [Solemya velum gill symbiont]
MTHWFKVILLYLLPHHSLSRIVQWNARCRHFPLRKSITRWFIRHYNVDMSEALEPDPEAYPDFNSFFTRALRPEARPIVQNVGHICCPADSTISKIGDIQGTQIFQAKGHTYSLVDLLGGSEERAQPFAGGRFATTYLSPGDYRRVHMPLSGQLVETVYIPGRLFSVAPDYTESVPRLFARNERVACVFQTEVGLMAVVLVGAIFVGSIETVWAGEITPPQGKDIKIVNYTTDDSIIQLKCGEEFGRFNMGGSTVIVLFGPGSVNWQTGLGPETRVQVGQALGRVQ